MMTALAVTGYAAATIGLCQLGSTPLSAALTTYMTLPTGRLRRVSKLGATVQEKRIQLVTTSALALTSDFCCRVGENEGRTTPPREDWRERKLNRRPGTIDVFTDVLTGLKVKDFVVPHIQNSFVGVIGIETGREGEDTQEKVCSKSLSIYIVWERERRSRGVLGFT